MSEPKKPPCCANNTRQLARMHWRVTPLGRSIVHDDWLLGENNCTIFHELQAYSNEPSFTLERLHSILNNYLHVLVEHHERELVAAALARLPLWIDEMTQLGYLEPL